MYNKRNKELVIINLFRGNYKSRFYLREISKLTKIPLKTTQNILVNLEKENILKSKIEGKNKYFYLNLENIKTKSILLQAEIYQTDLFMEKYPKIKIFLKELNTKALLIIFGSFAKFKATKDSDLDLLIIGKKTMPEHLLSFKVHKITLSEKDFLKAIKTQEDLIKEIEENHIILNNAFSYVNTMWSYYVR